MVKRHAKTRVCHSDERYGHQSKIGKDILPGCEIIVPMKKERKRMTFSEIMSLGSITATLGAVIATLVK